MKERVRLAISGKRTKVAEAEQPGIGGKALTASTRKRERQQCSDIEAVKRLKTARASPI
jgi:hypothetical protein